MKWWVRQVTRHELSIALQKVTLFNILVMILPIPLQPKLLIVFGISSFTFLLGIFKAVRILQDIKHIGRDPNNGTWGWFIIALNGLIFALSLLLPNIPPIKAWVATHTFIWSLIVTFSYANAVWTFFLLMKRADVDPGHRQITPEALKDEKLKERTTQLKSTKIHLESQGEAIAELAPETQQKINDLTAVKDIKKVAKLNKKVK